MNGDFYKIKCLEMHFCYSFSIMYDNAFKKFLMEGILLNPSGYFFPSIIFLKSVSFTNVLILNKGVYI